MNTHGSEPAVRLTPPGERATAVIEALADTTPLIRPLACATPGLRSFSVEGDAYRSITVTEMGHWFHVGDKLAMPDDAPVGWACRGCGVVATASLLAPSLGRCPKPASAQDIASALLADYPRPAPVAPRALYAGVSA